MTCIPVRPTGTAVTLDTNMMRQVQLMSVSELCQILPETEVKQRDLRGHFDAHHCCGKSLMVSALVRVDVRQRARTESISKRARSTTPTSLRFRINELRRSRRDYRTRRRLARASSDPV
jgi:hypothetical protein